MLGGFIHIRVHLKYYEHPGFFLNKFPFGLYWNNILLESFEGHTVQFIRQYRPSSKINKVKIFENSQPLGNWMLILCDAKYHQKMKYLIF